MFSRRKSSFTMSPVSPIVPFLGSWLGTSSDMEVNNPSPFSLWFEILEDRAVAPYLSNLIQHYCVCTNQQYVYIRNACIEIILLGRQTSSNKIAAKMDCSFDYAVTNGISILCSAALPVIRYFSQGRRKPSKNV